jgi:hypothetical protein
VTYCHLWWFPIFHGLLQCDPPSDVHATPRPWCPQLRQTGNSTTLNASMAHTIPPGRSGTPLEVTSSCRFDVLSLCSARDCRNQIYEIKSVCPTCWDRVAQPDITHKCRDSVQPTFDASWTILSGRLLVDFFPTDTIRAQSCLSRFECS